MYPSYSSVGILDGEREREREREREIKCILNVNYFATDRFTCINPHIFLNKRHLYT